MCDVTFSMIRHILFIFYIFFSKVNKLHYWYYITRIETQGDNAPQFWMHKYTTEANKYWHAFYKRNTDHFYKDRHYLHVVFPELISSPIPWSIDNKHYCDYHNSIYEQGVNQSVPPSNVGSYDNGNNINDSYSSSNTSNSSGNFFDNRYHLLEVGCGVGNAVLPLLEINPHLCVHAIDFAESAITILKQNKYAFPTTINSNNDCLSISGLPLLPPSTPQPQPPRLIPNVCDIVNNPLPVPDGSMDVVLCMFVLSAIHPKVI